MAPRKAIACAQIFEAVGLSEEVVAEYFTGTASRIGGIGMDGIHREIEIRHERAFSEPAKDRIPLDAGGLYRFRKDGEHHSFNPETVHKLQCAVRDEDYQAFKEYSHLIDDQSKRMCTLRGLMDVKANGEAISIDKVEPVESIMKRFKSGAMSYGAISQEAHETLAIAMNRIGGMSNTGEGGEDSERYEPDANGDSRNSAIKQIASVRFGVTSNYLVNAKELQIKIAQCAKPGKAASCRAERFTRRSPRCGMPRPASD